MKMFNKTLLAAAMLASAGAANANILTGSSTANELFLAVYNPTAANADGTLGLTYNLDLNITYSQVAANAASAFASINSVIGNLASDSKWTSFTSLITSPSSVKWVVAGGYNDQATAPGVAGSLITGASMLANPDPLVLVNSLSDALEKHAVQINAGMAPGANSSLIQNVPATPIKGQFTPSGLPANGAWNGWPMDPTASYGSSNSLWIAANDPNGIDPFGDPAWQLIQADIVKIGSLTLAGNALTFTPNNVASVPLPGAVWLFGAGLMGVLRSSRRKSA